MHKLVSYNVNGLRAFNNKGGLEAIMSRTPDMIFFNETKSDYDNFLKITEPYSNDYDRYLNDSKYKKGYAGEGLLIKKSLSDRVVSVSNIELGETYESGRIIQVELDSCIIIGVYMLNSGNKDDLRREYDISFRNLISSLFKPVIILGDLNVVSTHYDYHGNWINDINSMPGLQDYEIINFHNLLKDCELIDSFRHLYPTQKQYSWFSYMGNSYSRNKGWRIDYALVSKSLIDKVTDSSILSDLRFSDHMAVELTLDL